MGLAKGRVIETELSDLKSDVVDRPSGVAAQELVPAIRGGSIQGSGNDCG